MSYSDSDDEDRELMFLLVESTAMLPAATSLQRGWTTFMACLADQVSKLDIPLEDLPVDVVRAVAMSEALRSPALRSPATGRWPIRLDADDDLLVRLRGRIRRFGGFAAIRDLLFVRHGTVTMRSFSGSISRTVVDFVDWRKHRGLPAFKMHSLIAGAVDQDRSAKELDNPEASH